MPGAPSSALVFGRTLGLWGPGRRWSRRRRLRTLRRGVIAAVGGGDGGAHGVAWCIPVEIAQVPNTLVNARSLDPRSAVRNWSALLVSDQSEGANYVLLCVRALQLPNLYQRAEAGTRLLRQGGPYHVHSCRYFSHGKAGRPGKGKHEEWRRRTNKKIMLVE